MRRASLISIAILFTVLTGCAAHTEPPAPAFRYQSPVRIAVVNEWSEPPREVYIASFFTHNQRNQATSELDLGAFAIEMIQRTLGARPGVEVEVIPAEAWTRVIGEKLRFRRINPSGTAVYQAYQPETEARLRDFADSSGFDAVIHLQSNRTGAGVMGTNQTVRHWGAFTRGYVKSPSQHWAYHHLSVNVHSLNPPYYMGDGTEDFLDSVSITRIQDACQDDVREGIFEQCREVIEEIVLAQIAPEVDLALRRLAQLVPRG